MIIVVTLMRTSSHRDTPPLSLLATIARKKYIPAMPLAMEMVGPDFNSVNECNMVIVIIVMTLMWTTSRGGTLPHVPSGNYGLCIALNYWRVCIRVCVCVCLSLRHPVSQHCGQSLVQRAVCLSPQPLPQAAGSRVRDERSPRLVIRHDPSLTPSYQQPTLKAVRGEGSPRLIVCRNASLTPSCQQPTLNGSEMRGPLTVSMATHDFVTYSADPGEVRSKRSPLSGFHGNTGLGDVHKQLIQEWEVALSCVHGNRWHFHGQLSLGSASIGTLPLLSWQRTTWRLP